MIFRTVTSAQEVIFAGKELQIATKNLAQLNSYVQRVLVTLFYAHQAGTVKALATDWLNQPSVQKVHTALQELIFLSLAVLNRYAQRSLLAPKLEERLQKIANQEHTSMLIDVLSASQVMSVTPIRRRNTPSMQRLKVATSAHQAIIAQEAQSEAKA